MLLTSCGNRRETVCPACSAVYKRDARQLVRAGLSGGKGIPDTIAAHPCVFATLTAPSFGPVHSRRMRGKTVLPCRPRRDANARRCPHGRDISCPRRHGEDDPRLGRPLCGDCYDYDRRRPVQRLRGGPVAPVHHLPAPPPRPPGRAHRHQQLRDLAADPLRQGRRIPGPGRGPLPRHHPPRRPRRRLPAPPAPASPPPAVRRHRQAAAAAASPSPPTPGRPAVTAVRHPDRRRPPPRRRAARHRPALSVQAVGNYLAKYATKALDAPGVPDRPLRSGPTSTGCAARATTGG